MINLRSGAWGAQRLTRRPPTLVLRPAHSLTTANRKEKSSCLFITFYADQPATICCQKTDQTPTKNNRTVTG